MSGSYNRKGHGYSEYAVRIGLNDGLRMGLSNGYGWLLNMLIARDGTAEHYAPTDPE